MNSIQGRTKMQNLNFDYQQTWDTPFNAQAAQRISSLDFIKTLGLHEVLEPCKHEKVVAVICSCCNKELPFQRCDKCAAIFCRSGCVEVMGNLVENGLAVEEFLSEPVENQSNGQAMESSSSEPLESQDYDITTSLERFTQQPSLLTYKNDTFVILNVQTFNRVHIMSTDVLEEMILELIDDINDICLDSPCIEGDLKVGDLVCAPYVVPGKEDVMQRGVVVQVEPNDCYSVRFVDFGRTEQIAKSKLKLLTDELLRIPILGYEVRIRGVPDDLPLLLLNDFEEFAQFQLLERRIKIADISTPVDNVYEVSMLTDKDQSVANKILALEKWEWERLFETGQKDDLAIKKNPEWNEIKQDLTTPLFTTTITPQRPVKMKLSQFDPNNFVLTFKNIQIDEFIREQAVLYRQIDRYVNMVAKSSFFPIISEPFLIQLDHTVAHDIPPNFWLRAIRTDAEELYCVDTGCHYPFKELNHNFRIMCPEFLKVPPFAIKCILSGFMQNEKLKKAIVATFRPNEFYDVDILNFNKKTSYYTVRCNHEAVQQYLSSPLVN